MTKKLSVSPEQLGAGTTLEAVFPPSLDRVTHRGCGGALLYKFARIVHDTFRPGYLVCVRCGRRDIRPDEREPRGNVCLASADA